jgi:nucleoside-diphosphate kinase
VERTLIILKPDCVQRRLIGRVIQRFEAKGLTISAMKMIQMTRELTEAQYAPHIGKPYFAGLLKHITSGPVVVMVVSGPRAIAICRQLVGKTFGFEAEPGTIRGDFGASSRYNLVHGSDSPESAEMEIALYFTSREIIDFSPADSDWIVAPDEV